MSHSGTLYLVPNFLGESREADLLPAANSAILRSLKYFVVEELRAARQLIARTAPGSDIDSLHFFLLNEHSDAGQLPQLLAPLLAGHDMGIVSEAGCPAVADPGAALVRLAQQHDVRVIPLTGPSSILLALMASGLNGQSFAFEGYLPKDRKQRMERIRDMDRAVQRTGGTRIFIEAPHRNQHLLEDILANASPGTLLCLACNLQSADEFIRTRTIAGWMKQPPVLTKKPVIFLLGI